MRDWELRMDMTRDGIVTISDVWEFLYSLFFYPGDWVVSKIIYSDFGIFFEFSGADYGGAFSGCISFLVWLFAYLLFSTACKIISALLESSAKH